jgi:hypothetical protein
MAPPAIQHEERGVRGGLSSLMTAALVALDLDSSRA